MSTQSFRVLTLAAFLPFAASSFAQSSVSSGSNSAAPSVGPAPIAAPSSAAPVPAGAVVASTPAATVSGVPVVDPAAAVKSVIAMFTPNDTVIVPGLAKPLPQTGTWGAQTRFPNGPPKPCLLAAVPCVRIVYNVPEAKVTCEWLLGYLVAAEPQPDGTIKHALHEVVLDENADAARYTLRKSWSSGEHSPKPVDEHAPVYPVAAQSAGIDGVVVVRIVIGPDGSVVSASGISGPKMLQGPAIDAVRQWKFDPPRVGSQSTSYRLDEYFSYNRGRPVYGNGDSSGRIVIPNADPHYAPGYKSVTTSGTEWETCSAVNCTNAAPPVPK